MTSVWPDAFSRDEGSDQFGMALPKQGMIGTITRRALEAGCDLYLHGNGSRDFAHTLEMMAAAPNLTHAQFTRINNLLKPRNPRQLRPLRCARQAERAVAVNNEQTLLDHLAKQT